MAVCHLGNIAYWTGETVRWNPQTCDTMAGDRQNHLGSDFRRRMAGKASPQEQSRRAEHQDHPKQTHLKPVVVDQQAGDRCTRCHE